LERVSNVIGKYRLIAELGHGGMADVYLAVAHGPARFNKLVVIKQIRAQFAEDPEFLSMFLDEARLAARLSHPNVVQTNEVGDDAGRYFMAMEYLEGQPLNRITHRVAKSRGPNGGLDLGVYLRILVDVLAGLHHAHDLADYDGTPLGVVHRDVTPHNVFVTYDGQVKIVDFGIAKALSSSAETRTGVLKGKVAYMAPEQMRGERVDRRADVFSVGVMLWEASTGRRLWKGKPDVAILSEVTSGRMPPPSTVNPDVPPRLESICMRALAPDRDERYASAAELSADIESFLDDRAERLTLRDLGRLVSSVFQDERAQLRAIVDNQLRSTRDLVTDEWRAVSLPRIADPPTTGPQPDMDPARSAGWDPGRSSGTPPGVRSDPPEGSDPRSDPRISHPSDPRMGDGHGSDPRRYDRSSSGAPADGHGSDPRRYDRSSSGAPADGHGSDPRSDPRLAFRDGTPVTGPSRTSQQLAVATGSLPAPLDPQARRLRLVAVSGLVALLTVGLGVFLVAKSSSTPGGAEPATGSPERVSASTAAAVTATPPPPAPPEPIAPAVVTVTIQASPPEARLLLDGKPLSGNPFKGTLPRDGAEHSLRVEAKGHEALERTLRLERDVTMSLALTREPVAGSQARPPFVPRQPPEPDPDEMKPKPRPKRPLDDENPYAPKQ
jgi:serine/threonine-protein kinase